MLRQHGAGFAGGFVELTAQRGADERLIYMKKQEEVVNRISCNVRFIPQNLAEYIALDFTNNPI